LSNRIIQAPRSTLVTMPLMVVGSLLRSEVKADAVISNGCLTRRSSASSKRWSAGKSLSDRFGACRRSHDVSQSHVVLGDRVQVAMSRRSGPGWMVYR
jgi:hypothetical protein